MYRRLTKSLQRPSVRRFGQRLIICMLILGGLYWLLFGVLLGSHNQTPSQKIAGLRATLKEVSLLDSNLATFRENTPVSSYDLGSLASSLQTDLKQLQTQRADAPTKVTQHLKQQLGQVITSEQSTYASYSHAMTVLGQIITYDPSTDLNGIGGKKLAQRAQAAQQGLAHVLSGNSGNVSGLGVQNSSGSLLTNSVQSSLETEARCLGQLATAATHFGINTEPLRQHCIKAYPSVRQAAIKAVQTASFSASHHTALLQQVSPLLQALDQL
ncbi:MAG TPA: hypothetical protein VG992_05100 [Candidatus Saccharimonadales bacterium]|nr:hypothetical protein [Candidatus Saccharimonadales bacterium]